MSFYLTGRLCRDHGLDGSRVGVVLVAVQVHQLLLAAFRDRTECIGMTGSQQLVGMGDSERSWRATCLRPRT